MFWRNYGPEAPGLPRSPVTGNYTFWIASRWRGRTLAQHHGVAVRNEPASPPSMAGPPPGNGPARGTSNRADSQKSGQIYYVEALMKEGGGGDNLAVRWLRPDGVDEADPGFVSCPGA